MISSGDFCSGWLIAPTNYSSRFKTSSVSNGIANRLLFSVRMSNRFFVILAWKLGLRLFRNRLSYFWKYKLSSDELMKACIKFYYSVGIPTDRMAVFAEVIFLVSAKLREFNSRTSTANSPKRFAKIMAPDALNRVPMTIYSSPLGCKSFPIR